MLGGKSEMEVTNRKFGLILIDEPGKPLVEKDFYFCCHCQDTVVVKPGSGKLRTWCYMCNQGTCGRPSCVKGCIPFEAKLEAMEGTRKFWKNLDLQGKKF